MEFIIRPRRSGKTTDMLMWLNGHPDRVLVAHSEQEKQRILKWIEDRKMHIDEIQIITLSDRERLRGQNVRIGIDNLDMILYYLFSGGVDIVSATGHLADRA